MYSDHFKHADDLIVHLNGIVPTIPDAYLQAKYVGFISVVGVTVYELAIKEIFITFAKKKHKVLGNFTESYFERLNGRVRIRNIKEDYIPKFGDKYLKRFKRKVDVRSKKFLRQNRRDLPNAYTNLIIWRNQFAHEGKVITTATYDEVVQGYHDGKEVLQVLYETMRL